MFRRILSLAFATLIAVLGYSQAGSIDPTFNAADQGFGIGEGVDNTVRSLSTMPDGRIIVGGRFTTVNGLALQRVMRMGADGLVDMTFTPGDLGSSSIQCLVAQPDGKVLIGGDFTTYDGASRNRIARLNADGSLDPSFVVGTGLDNTVNSIALQSDGKVLVVGLFNTYNGTARKYVVRLNSDGGLDNTFDPGVSANLYINTVLSQPDGSIVLGGRFTTFSGLTRRRIVRLNSDGSVDPSFDPGTGGSSYVHAIAIQADGKYVVGGEFTTFSGSARNRVVRLNADGSLDGSFNPGSGANNIVRTLAIQSDGKILIGGDLTSFNGVNSGGLLRLNTNGTIDGNFQYDTGANAAVYSILVMPDQRILAGGDFTEYDGHAPARVMRIGTDGSIDETFNPGSGANDVVESICLQNDERILIGGYFTSFNGRPFNYVARLTADGELDGTFTPGIGPNDRLRRVVVQPDGKILIGGYFTSYNGTTRNRIARLNEDGSLDASFNSSVGANGTVESIEVQPDGKILIGGAFTTYNGTARNRIARLNSNGSLDTGFNPGTGASDAVYSILQRSDGRILIGGNFTTYNGVARARIALLNTNGSLDTAFDPGAGANGIIYDMAIQPDGAVVVVGVFTGYGGISRSRVARLHSNGTLDGSFNPGIGANTLVRGLALQADGKVIIVGFFGLVNNVLRSRIARLHADGALDTSFDPGIGLRANVPTFGISDVVLDDQERIIIGGIFNSYNGTGRNRLARILGVEVDSDGDGVLDDVDNCPGIANPGQEDDDGDGIGNACDACLSAWNDIANFDTNTCACELGYYATTTDIGGNEVITSCTICPPGSFCADGINAAPCPAGRYQDQPGQIVCTDCAAGTFNATVGAISCQACDAGTFSSITGSTSCTACPEGTFSAATGASVCTSCPAGFANSLTGQTACAACPPGSFSANQGQAVCELCPAGTYNAVEAQTECLSCSNGETSNAGATECTPAVACTDYILELQSGTTAPSAVTYEVLDETGTSTILSGNNPIPANSTGTLTLCLSDGCYQLRITDAAGDGLLGYVLREMGMNGRRVIDNAFNMSDGVSAIANGGIFCVPLGDDRPIFSSCDKLDWVNNKFIVCHANAAVSAQYGVTNTTSGYEFWFFDPNGSFSYRRFRSHATSDGYGSGATRACHFKINGWFANVANPHLPANVLLNVRVRGRVAGTNQAFGPACQFKIDAALAACPRVKLQDNPANVDDYSCGVSRNFGGPSNVNNRIYANPPQPIPVVASSAVRYQFRFRITGENVCIVRPPQQSARMVLNWTTGTPLECSKTYEVDVRVSLDGGATWCFGPAASSEAAACADTEAWGKVCLVTINPCALPNGGGNSMVVEGNDTFTMYPNPNRGDQLFLSVSNVEEGVNTVNVDIFDMAGKRVMARTIAVQDGFVNGVLDLEYELANGIYLVNITAGSKAYTERLIIQ